MVFYKYLSYWKEVDTPHAIDCMDLEKNIFESRIGFLLDINGNTKDGLKSRIDLFNKDIRPELYPGPLQNEKGNLPVACINVERTTTTRASSCGMRRMSRSETGISCT